ncbi:hypothetical protein [Pectobacterium aroidearum]|uniref:hypothetical protein n=1 Tax=Pectobacterium aroidearum TaxID=1201031 RepID=UPI002114A93B|nr:hypothetical protein [Pectobacterium aroidearum]UUE59612.1 hypothetical protein L0Y27_10240 [Pectobacterium aroidearum]UUE72440.1 hypothetical protein L0Y21_10910 [Pectobacterium aroidearum]UUE76840.1 hypothetical protein L0Y20_11015 [Pectobacterium aroidearum]UUE81064.1 hypothetical protein L0Y24_10455 [Pectobacterium aroidearum]
MRHLNYLWVAFLTIFFATSLSLSAATQTLTPSEIEAFNAQIANAQRIDTALVAKGQCYADKDTELEANSHRLEETAGELHAQKQKLATELERAAFAAKEFSNRFEMASRERHDLENKMQEIKHQIHAREAALNNCKRQFGFLDFMCDFAGEITGLNGDLRRLDGARREIDIRASAAKERYEAARNENNQAEVRLHENQMKSEQNSADIAAVENKIGMLKVSLAEIRKLKQDNATLLARFTDSIAELNGLDPASDRRFIVNRLHQESESLNVLLLKSQELLDINGLQLPDGERICTN